MFAHKEILTDVAFLKKDKYMGNYIAGFAGLLVVRFIP